MRHVEADRLAARLQRHKDLHIRIGLPAARMRDAGCHAVRGCGRHNRDAVRGTLHAAVGVVARHAQRKLVGTRFHDENVVIVEVVARVRAADVLGAVFAAGFCLDSGLVAHVRIAALPVKVLGLDLRHALRRHNRLGLHLDVKVVDIPAFMRCIEPDGLEARIQRHIQIDVGVRLPSACERDCADHALRRRRRHDGHAVRGSFHAAVRVVARHAQAELVGACVFHIDVMVEHVVACIGAAHVLAAPDVAAGFNLDAGLASHGRVAALFVVVLRLDAGDGISAYNRLSHVADVCQLHGKRHRFGGHDKAIRLIPGNFHHLQCSAVRIHRLDRLHGLSCRQAGDGNRHGLAQSRLCRRAQGCFLPVRHLDRIGFARSYLADLPELHVVDLHGGVPRSLTIKRDINLAVRYFNLRGEFLINTVEWDIDQRLLLAVIACQLHSADVSRCIGHLDRRIHTVDPIRQSCNRLAEPAFIGASIIEIEFIVAAKRIVFIYAMARRPGDILHRPAVQASVFKAAVRDRYLCHNHGLAAHRRAVEIDVRRIAFLHKDGKGIFPCVEVNGHRNLIPEGEILHTCEKHLLRVLFVSVCIDAHRLCRAGTVGIPQEYRIVALFRDRNTGETYPVARVAELCHVSEASITAEGVFALRVPQDLRIFRFEFIRGDRRAVQRYGGCLGCIGHLHITDLAGSISIIAGLRRLERFQGVIGDKRLTVLLDGDVFIRRLVELHQVAARRNICVAPGAFADLEENRRAVSVHLDVAGIRSRRVYPILIGVCFTVILIEDKVKTAVLQRGEYVQCQNIDRFFADIFHLRLHRDNRARLDKDREQRNRRGIL